MGAMSDTDALDGVTVTLEFSDPESFSRELRGLVEVVAMNPDDIADGDYAGQMAFIGLQAQIAMENKRLGDFFNHTNFHVTQSDLNTIPTLSP